jgi:hypothetical protein
MAELTDDTVSKRELDRLGQMFAAEVDHAIRNVRFPQMFQCRPSKLMAGLEAKGMIESVTFTDSHGGFGARFEGWVLTHAGRFTYCESCDEPKLKEKPAAIEVPPVTHAELEAAGQMRLSPPMEGQP